MPLHLKSTQGLMIAAAIAVACTAIAWTGSGQNRQNEYADRQDTVPVMPKRDAHKEKSERAIDEEIERMEHSLEQLDTKMENAGWENMEAQLEAALKKIDIEMESRQIDVEDIDENIGEALENIDFEEIGKESADMVQQGRENIDFKEIQANVQRALAEAADKMNSSEIRERIGETQEGINKMKENLERVRTELKKNKTEVDAGLEKARAAVDKSKTS